jgi:hypothetical protein
MVWGMPIPSKFGEFWPDGNFEGELESGVEGWVDRLRLHYLEQTQEEQKRLFDYGSNGVGYGASKYGFYVYTKFISEAGTKRGPDMPPCTAIEPHEAPQFFATVKSYEKLGSLINLNGRILAVDDALKAIIERLEPGMHGFFPIEIRMPSGKVFSTSYYTLHIGQYFDSFAPNDSKPDSWSMDGDYYRKFKDSKDGITGLAFSPAIFGNPHFWRERRFDEWLTCFSDELQAEIVKAGLSMPKYYKMKAA